MSRWPLPRAEVPAGLPNQAEGVAIEPIGMHMTTIAGADYLMNDAQQLLIGTIETEASAPRIAITAFHRRREGGSYGLVHILTPAEARGAAGALLANALKLERGAADQADAVFRATVARLRAERAPAPRPSLANRIVAAVNGEIDKLEHRLRGTADRIGNAAIVAGALLVATMVIRVAAAWWVGRL